MVRPERFELPTLWFVARCSIQLSYGRSTKQPTEISIIAETLRLMKLPAGRQGFGGQELLCPLLNIFFFTVSTTFWQYPCAATTPT
jgi:hypothetical protein